MKTNDHVLYRRADGCVFSAVIVDTMADGNLHLRPLESTQHRVVPAIECAPLADAFAALQERPGLLTAAGEREKFAQQAKALADELTTVNALASEMSVSLGKLKDANAGLEAANARLTEKLAKKPKAKAKA